MVLSASIDNAASHTPKPYNISFDDRARGLKMRVIVKKRSNSASVRIPAAIMQAASLKLDETVDVRGEGGRIVIEPIRPSHYSLEQLLTGITPENLHAEVDFT